MSHIEQTDPEVYSAIENERRRQVEKIELIASENYTSAAVMEATGSVLTNKYAEGYPGRRYYGGCEWVDVAESLAIERAKALFGAAHANVQPHAGAQANMAAYAALLKPGDGVLGLALDQGGHLTHGSPVNFSGKLYHFTAYGVRKDDELLDYDDLERLAKEHRPKLIVSGGTDNHLMLVDVRPLSLTGKAAEKALDAVGITVNKNTIPYDPNKPAVASGIRVGTPAVTTRGMKEAEMERIGALIGRILQAKGDETVAKDVAAEVLDLTRRYPVPGITPERVAS